MIGGNVSAALEAGQLIGIVLVEAVVLYLGYGAVADRVGHRVIERITDI